MKRITIVIFFTVLCSVSGAQKLREFSFSMPTGESRAWSELREVEQKLIALKQAEDRAESRKDGDPSRFFFAQDFFFALDSALKLDLYYPFTELQKHGVRICSAKRAPQWPPIRVFCWDNGLGGSAREYDLIVQYWAGPGVTRIEGQGRLVTPQHAFDEDMAAIAVDTVAHLRDGIFLLCGTVTSSTALTGCGVIAFDFSRGIMRPAYIFTDPDGEPSYIFAAQYPIDERLGDDFPRCAPDGERLSIPGNDSLGNYAGQRELIYNGARYETAEDREKRYARYQCNDNIIDRVIFREFDNRRMITGFVPGDRISTEAWVTCDSTADVEDERLDISFVCDHLKGKPKVELRYLKVHNARAVVENLDADRIAVASRKIRKHRWWNGKQKVTAVAGKERAFPCEELTYTAVLYKFTPTEEDCRDNICWIIEIDGVVDEELTDWYRYAGNQIRLKMNPDWLGKTIKVIPYIDKPDPKVATETIVW